MLTIYGSDTDPSMLLGTLSIETRAVALDLAAGAVRWQVELPAFTAAQFPSIQDDQGHSVVVVPTRNAGAYGIGVE